MAGPEALNVHAASHGADPGAFRAWTAGAASAAAYGFGPTIAALAYAGGVTPVTLATLRGLAGSLVLGLAMSCGMLRGLPRRAVLGTVLIGGPLYGAQLLFYFAAIQRMGAQTAVVLVHVYPLLVVTLLWLRTRQAVGREMAALLACVVFGVALVAGTGARGLTRAGVTLAFGSALAYALYVVLGESWIRKLNPLAAGGLVTLGATMTTGALAVLSGQSLRVSGSAWVPILLQGLLVIPVGLGGAFVALKFLGPVSASLLAMLEPVVGVVVAGLFLGERLAPLQWAGAAVVVLACGILPLIQERSRGSVSHAGDCVYPRTAVR
jgi:drug/metabolite transporter (DMT)-like permease